ncbi:MAG: DUF6438 domain-containing protein [Gemmatimonadaceae bacterium]|nr:DUF6438 domain-containing protein [Gemmatimonadaceae bacterium]
MSARGVWRVALVCGVLGASAACARRDGGGGDASGGDAVVLRVERGPCRGQCPVYAVDVTQAGRVRFDGRRYVADSGRRERSVPAASVRGVLARFEASAFATTDTAITQDHLRCGRYVTDLPWTAVSGMVRQRLHTVRFDRGCSGVPRFLDSLAMAVDSLAQTKAWVGGSR